MATFVRFHQFAEDLAKKVHNLSSDSLKYMFTNTAPNAATNAVKADITEITAKNGYPSGGIALTGVTAEQVSGIVPLITDDKTFTADSSTDGTGVGPFRYVVLYNDTPSSPADPLIGYWDRGASITLSAGDSILLDADPTNGLFQIGS